MFNVPVPELQIDFALSMRKIRRLYLQNALNATVRRLSIPEIDRELAAFVPLNCMASLAGHGLRSEMMFPIPSLLQANPRLLGYYRLLYGYSQKEFYTTKTGLSRFKGLEERGIIPVRCQDQIAPLCQALCTAGEFLLAGVGTIQLNARVLDELTLLTLGPQLRGGANVRRGTAGIQVVFNVIRKIVEASMSGISENKIEVLNAAGRKVLIEFSADPDIIIRVEMATKFRKLIAIEIKAGSDFSNIHNRLGEAEKSHQKARRDGYVECWTVVNVDRFNEEMARQESPSTNRFYKIADLLNDERPHIRTFASALFL